jgi:methyl-accepting chemotaxis protein
MGSGGIADSEIAELNRGIDRIASGDLTHRVERNWDHTELDSLAASINELVRDIESVLIETQSFGVQVSTTTDRVSAQTTELRREMETATDAVEATVSAATRQHQLLREVRADIMTLSRSLGNVTASADSLASLSTRVLREAESTAGLDKPSREKFEELEKEALGTARKLGRIESTSDEIVSKL